MPENNPKIPNLQRFPSLLKTTRLNDVENVWTRWLADVIEPRIIEPKIWIPRFSFNHDFSRDSILRFRGLIPVIIDYPFRSGFGNVRKWSKVAVTIDKGWSRCALRTGPVLLFLGSREGERGGSLGAALFTTNHYRSAAPYFLSDYFFVSASVSGLGEIISSGVSWPGTRVPEILIRWNDFEMPYGTDSSSPSISFILSLLSSPAGGARVHHKLAICVRVLYTCFPYRLRREHVLEIRRESSRGDVNFEM